MSKQVTIALFDLVKSLNRREKAYFKKFASRHVIGDRNKYVDLFDALCSVDKYEESLMEESGIKSENPDKLKKYLYDLILKSLKEYSSQKMSTQVKINEIMAYVEILTEKGLHAQCLNHIRKAQKLAVKSDNQLLLLQLNRIENEKRKLLEDVAFLNKTDERLNNEFKIFDRIKGQLESEALDNYMMCLHKLHHFGDNEKLMEGLEFYKNHKAFSKKELNTFEEKFYHYRTKHIYYFSIGDKKMVYNWSEKLIELFDEEPIFKIEKTDLYVLSLLELVKSQYSLRKYGPMKDTFNKLIEFRDQKSVQEKTRHLEGKLFIELMIFNIRVNNAEGNFKNSHSFFQNGQKEFERLAHCISDADRMMYYFVVGILFMGLERQGEAIKYFHQIAGYRRNVRLDLNYFSELLSMLVLYERGDHEFLYYKLKKFKKSPMFPELTRSVSRLFNQLLSGKKRTKDLFDKFKPQIEKEYAKTQMTEYFDLGTWIDANYGEGHFNDLLLDKHTKEVELFAENI